MAALETNSGRTRWLTLAAVTLAVGIVAGLGGMAVGLLLHLVQHIAYGYSLHAIVGPENFLQGTSAASPLRRLVVLCVCGAVAGSGWWAIYRFGRPLVTVSKAVAENGEKIPLFTTIAHDFLQVVTVGMGSPLGRESAPREVSAALATQIVDRAGLTPEQSRIMIACAAGAGLAAVYNVPLGGTLFTLEVLLGTFSFSALIPALATSVIATVVAWIGLGSEAQYALPPLSISTPLVVWSVVMGPVFGFAAYGFVRAAGAAHARAPKDWRLPVWCALVFPAIGVLAMRFPEVLGNGRGVALVGFDNDVTIGLAAALLGLRMVASLGALRAGATGGLMTPGLTFGALLGIVLGGAWNHAFTAVPLGAFAVVGSAAFLASSMKMPLTAIVLMLEFTRVGQDFLIPMLFAVSGSISVYSLCTQHILLPFWELHHDDLPKVREARAAAGV
jgi:H+/Cl- antiporter ClcA